MPVTTSALKKMRQDRKKTSRNRLQLEKMRDTVKEVNTIVRTKVGDAASALSAAYKKLDKAAKKNLISPRTAARKKSLLARTVAPAPKK